MCRSVLGVCGVWYMVCVNVICVVCVTVVCECVGGCVWGCVCVGGVSS